MNFISGCLIIDGNCPIEFVATHIIAIGIFIGSMRQNKLVENFEFTSAILYFIMAAILNFISSCYNLDGNDLNQFVVINKIGIDSFSNQKRQNMSCG